MHKTRNKFGVRSSSLRHCLLCGLHKLLAIARLLISLRTTFHISSGCVMRLLRHVLLTGRQNSAPSISSIIVPFPS